MGMLLKIFFSIFAITSIEARPISYSGGSTLMSMSDNMKDSIYYHYSPTFMEIGKQEDSFLDLDIKKSSIILDIMLSSIIN